ncbi:MAG TPA: hypothetical protein VHW00_16825 [Thermoanaerobaculia bacterium]|nr:hypothetical protein [Thermoanaerobaculia bacterium]
MRRIRVGQPSMYGSLSRGRVFLGLIVFLLCAGPTLLAQFAPAMNGPAVHAGPAEVMAGQRMELLDEQAMVRSVPNANALGVDKVQPDYRANDLSLEGAVSGYFSNGLLRLTADKVANNRSSGTSGTLRLSLWATTYKPVYGSTLTYRLGYYQFTQPLPAGYYFGPVDRTVAYGGDPPPGTYYITMTVDEYDGNNTYLDGYSYHDLAVFTTTHTFGGSQCVPAAITVQPQPATASGGNATVSVVATGTAPLTYQWYVGASGNTAQPISGATSATQSLTNITSSISVWVRVTNCGGFVNSNSVVLTPNNVGGCTPNATTACLLNNRFRATLRYRSAFDNNPADSSALVKSVTGFATSTYETAFFYFNNPNNIEMLLKILDQGNTNGAGQPTIAVLFGSATPLRIELTLTDTNTGAVRVYTNNFGSQSGQSDFTAFVK